MTKSSSYLHGPFHDIDDTTLDLGPCAFCGKSENTNMISRVPCEKCGNVVCWECADCGVYGSLHDFQYFVNRDSERGMKVFLLSESCPACQEMSWWEKYTSQRNSEQANNGMERGNFAPSPQTREIKEVIDNDINRLKQAWLMSRSFADEQAYLAARVRHGQARHVFLDPDGTWDEWLIVAISYPTNVIYGAQCAGVNTDERLIEGYLVPLGGPQFVPEQGPIKLAALREVFHRGQHCMSDLNGQNLPNEHRVQLATLIEAIPYWHTT